MYFIPWFQVPHVNGDTTHIAALAPIIINEDTKGRVTEIYAGNANVIIKTKLDAAEVFQRMSEAIEGARNAELEFFAVPSPEAVALSERDSADLAAWLPGS
jgi:hypothetical protein